MGFKYTHRVYNDVHDTTATEQQVLALLAHFADDRTGQCFPSIETLARQTHLSRATVIRCLDALKRKGYLKWISGGRKKRGRVLSNLYKLTLPKPAPKRNEIVLSEFWEDASPSHGATPSSIDHPKKIPMVITRRPKRRAWTCRVDLILALHGETERLTTSSGRSMPPRRK